MRTVAAALILSALLAAPAAAGGELEREISHLLRFVGESGCTFVRNGTDHDSAEAREHIEKKYGYVKKRVSTAEDFIAYAAAGSSVTGRPYTVRCDGRERTSADWLTEELDRFRRIPREPAK